MQGKSLQALRQVFEDHPGDTGSYPRAEKAQGHPHGKKPMLNWFVTNRVQHSQIIVPYPACAARSKASRMGPSGIRPSNNALVFSDENPCSDRGNDGAIGTACKLFRYEGEYTNRGSRDSSAARLPTSSKAPRYSLNTFKLRISLPRLQAHLDAQELSIVQNHSELDRRLPPFDFSYNPSRMPAIFPCGRLREAQHLPAASQCITQALRCKPARSSTSFCSPGDNRTPTPSGIDTFPAIRMLSRFMMPPPTARPSKA